MKLFSNTFQTLEQGLDYSALKQKTISQNIANVDTPNYKAKDVSFKNAFQQAVQSSMRANRTDPRHYEFTSSSSSNSVIIRKNNSYQHNGNGVDIDHEMSELAENQIYYQALADRLNGKFNSLKTVIGGGR
ncbi:flagellar basal body rod protein FlgB [Bacillus songklensis]|uniref:Flagellar basal body rod protein FlgB n=1 Tax=Bacillus songklensis TaxID=1069116 RepID=A0ABV8AZ59_9BACI